MNKNKYLMQLHSYMYIKRQWLGYVLVDIDSASKYQEKQLVMGTE